MHAGKPLSVVTSLVIALAILTAACGAPDHDVSATDPDIPGELIVVRDTDDDDLGELFIVAADGSEAREVTDADAYQTVVVSPDGAKAAVIQGADNSQPIAIVDLATGEVSPLPLPAGAYYSPDWSPSGDTIVFVGTDYGHFATPTSGTSPGVIRDMLFIADANGTELHPVADSDGASAPTWSPDGSQLAYVRQPGIWVADADGAHEQEVTTGMQSVFWPTWSPVDSRIAFTGYENGFPAVYVANADGSGQTKLSPAGVYASDPAWSPDGSWIAFMSFERGELSLHIVRWDGSDHRVIATVERINRMAWSPDGRWIAFTSAYGGSDGPITAIHLNIIAPFDPDAETHTLLRDLHDWSAPAWRDRPETAEHP